MMILNKLLIPSLWFTDKPCIQPNPLGGRCEHDAKWNMSQAGEHHDYCYSDVMACCQSPEMQYFATAPTCLSNSHGYGYLTCDDAVRSRFPATNILCRAICSYLVSRGSDPTEDQEWSKFCHLESYTKGIQGVIPTGKCFNNWIFGHADPIKYSSPPQVIDGIETPALCQTECQKSAGCLNFQWTPAGHSNLSNNHSLPRCILKSEEQVKGSLDSNLTNVNAQYCFSEIPGLCEGKLLPCLSCDQKFSCVWASKSHISGWKYCDEKSDACDPDSVSTTDPPNIESWPPSIPSNTPSNTATTTSSQSPLTDGRLKSEERNDQSGSRQPVPIPAEDPEAEWIDDKARLDWIENTRGDLGLRRVRSAGPDAEEAKQKPSESTNEEPGFTHRPRMSSLEDLDAEWIGDEAKQNLDGRTHEEPGYSYRPDMIPAEDLDAEWIGDEAEQNLDGRTHEEPGYSYRPDMIPAEDPDAEWIGDEAEQNLDGRTHEEPGYSYGAAPQSAEDSGAEWRSNSQATIYESLK